jgi:hypothetical protein
MSGRLVLIVVLAAVVLAVPPMVPVGVGLAGEVVWSALRASRHAGSVVASAA